MQNQSLIISLIDLMNVKTELTIFLRLSIEQTFITNQTLLKLIELFLVYGLILEITQGKIREI